MEDRKFRKVELSLYNGKNGAPAFIAYKGRVYDVSNSFLWLGGVHQVLHSAGTDLTGSLAGAPHGEDLLERFAEVETLTDS